MLAPPVNASKAEWDRLAAETDCLILGPSATWAEEHYPVNVVVTKVADVFFSHETAAHRKAAVKVAAVGRIKVVTIDYRMVPYASYPAASEDV